MLYPLLVLAIFGPSRLAASQETAGPYSGLEMAKECFKVTRAYPAMNISALRAHDDLEEHRMEIWRATAPLRGFPPHVYSGWKGPLKTGGFRPSGTGQRRTLGGSFRFSRSGSTMALEPVIGIRTDTFWLNWPRRCVPT